MSRPAGEQVCPTCEGEGGYEQRLDVIGYASDWVQCPDCGGSGVIGEPKMGEASRVENPPRIKRAHISTPRKAPAEHVFPDTKRIGLCVRACFNISDEALREEIPLKLCELKHFYQLTGMDSLEFEKVLDEATGLKDWTGSPNGAMFDELLWRAGFVQELIEAVDRYMNQPSFGSLHHQAALDVLDKLAKIRGQE